MGGLQVGADGALAVGAVTFRTDAKVFALALRGSPSRDVGFTGHVATVVAKVFLRMSHDALEVIAPDEPLFPTERAFVDGQSRGVYAPADLVPFKLRPEVVMVGNVLGLSGLAVPQVHARLAFGAIDKRIFVHQDRWIDGAGRVYEGAPFSSLGVVYERAAAGSWNPLGVRATSDPAVIPNLSFTQQAPASIAEIAGMQPACFAPIPWAWRQSSGAQALPHDFTTEAPPYIGQGASLPTLNAASADQQLPTMTGDERLLLEGFTRDAPRYRAQLPVMKVVAAFDGGRLPLTLDTLFIDASQRRCTATFRALIPLADASEQLPVRVSLEATPRATAPVSARPGVRSPQTMAIKLADLRAASMPFSASATRSASPEPSATGLPFAQREPVPAHLQKAVLPAGAMSSTLDIDTPVAAVPSPPSPPSPPPPPPVVAPRPLVQLQSVTPSTAGPSAMSAPAIVAAPARVVVAAPPAPIQRPLPVAPALAYETHNSIAGEVVRVAPITTAQSAGDAVRLLWFAPAVMPQLRADRSFRFVLDALTEQPLDPDLDDPDAAANPAELEDRREVEHLLGSASPATETELRGALRATAGSAVRFARPLFVIEGALTFAHDAIDVLRATVAVGASHASEAPAVVEVMTAAQTFLASPGIPSAADVACGLAQRIRATFDRTAIASSASFDEAIAPTLTEKRSFTWRRVLGQRCVRGTFELGSGAKAEPSASQATFAAFIPEAMEPTLPGAKRLVVRALARAHPQIEETDPQPLSLEIMALALRVSVKLGAR